MWYSDVQELSAYEVLQDFSDTADDEIRDFLQMVARYIIIFIIALSEKSTEKSGHFILEDQ